MHRNIQKVLYAIARSRYAARFLGIAFQHFSKLIPVDRLYQDEQIIIFFHPDPFWEFHCVAVPKMAIPSFQNLDFSAENGKAVITDIFKNAQGIFLSRGFHDYRVFVNGGLYQDVPRLHFHLSSGLPLRGEMDDYSYEAPTHQGSIGNLRTAVIYNHPHPRRQIHYLISPLDDVPPLIKIDFNNPSRGEAILDIFRLAQKTISEKKLDAYSIVTEGSAAEPTQKLAFHLVSGQRKV